MKNETTPQSAYEKINPQKWYNNTILWVILNVINGVLIVGFAIMLIFISV